MSTETVDKQRLLETMNEEAAKSIKSWSDLYDSLKKQVDLYFVNPNRRTAEFSLALLMSFVVALEQNPEEGDALKITEAMNKLLVMGGDQTGIDVTFGIRSPEALTEAVKQLRSILAEALIPDEPEEDSPQVPGIKPGRVLH